MDAVRKTITDIDATKKVSDVKAGITTSEDCTVKVFNGLSDMADGSVIKDGYKLTLIDNEIPSIKTEYVLTTKKVPITGVSLNKPTLELVTGGSETLNATVQPSSTTMDKTIVWSSEDSLTATVDNGKVTAVKSGSTKIIAKSKADSSKKAECTVTITDPVPGP